MECVTDEADGGQHEADGGQQRAWVQLCRFDFGAIVGAVGSSEYDGEYLDREGRERRGGAVRALLALLRGSGCRY